MTDHQNPNLCSLCGTALELDDPTSGLVIVRAEAQLVHLDEDNVPAGFNA
jgi:hypothetical protein